MKATVFGFLLQLTVIVYLVTLAQSANVTKEIPKEASTKENPILSKDAERNALLKNITDKLSKILLVEEEKLKKEGVNQTVMVNRLSSIGQEKIKGDLLADVIKLIKIDNKPDDITAEDFKKNLVNKILANINQNSDGGLKARGGVGSGIMHAARSTTTFFRSLLRG